MKLNISSVVFLSSLILSATSCLPQVASPSAPASCKTGNLDEQSPETTEKVRAFVTELQNAVRSDNKNLVAGMISYPLSVSTESGERKVHSEKELVAEYARIFTPPLKALLLKQHPECVSRVGAQGFTISRGEIWFDVFPSGKLMVFTVTPVVMPDE